MITEDDLGQLQSTLLTGVIVGVGVQVLIFGTGATVQFQCPFERHDEKGVIVGVGHGENLATAPLIFDLLNARIDSAKIDEAGTLTLNFEDGRYLRIRSEANGLESYTINSRFGLVPVY